MPVSYRAIGPVFLYPTGTCKRFVWGFWGVWHLAFLTAIQWWRFELCVKLSSLGCWGHRLRLFSSSCALCGAALRSPVTHLEGRLFMASSLGVVPPSSAVASRTDYTAQWFCCVHAVLGSSSHHNSSLSLINFFLLLIWSICWAKHFSFVVYLV